MIDKSVFFKIDVEDTLEVGKIHNIDIEYNSSISKDNKVYFFYSFEKESDTNENKLDTLLLNDNFRSSISVKFLSTGNKKLRGFFLEKKISIKKNINDTMVNIITTSNKMYFSTPIYVKDTTN